MSPTATCFILCFCLATLSQLVIAVPSSDMPSVLIRQTTKTAYWNGWNSLEKLFVFGASYTGTGFDWLGEQPSPSNPLGNFDREPALAHVPNFVTYLTTQYNASTLLTYNFAYYGAPVDQRAIHGSRYENRNDMVHQVLGFLSTYAPRVKYKAPGFDWSSESTLFICFFGINDIYYTYNHQYARIAKKVFYSYRTNIDTLYAQGARNFLILNVPPLDLAPAFNTEHIEAGLLANAITDFNFRISKLVSAVSDSYPDAAFFGYDTHSLFQRILNDPASMMGLINHVPLVNLIATCQAYKNPQTLPSLGFFQKKCGVPVDQYFWMSGYHPTWPVHKLLAEQIATDLSH